MNMAVKHTIKTNGKEKTKVVRLTPSRAIRLHCVECMGFQASLVKICSSALCPLYPFRLGRASQRQR
jgi:hypothetical protein